MARRRHQSAYVGRATASRRAMALVSAETRKRLAGRRRELLTGELETSVVVRRRINPLEIAGADLDLPLELGSGVDAHDPGRPGP